MALYLVAGLNQSLSMVALSILLLRTSSEERFRGRVMGVRMLAIYTLPWAAGRWSADPGDRFSRPGRPVRGLGPAADRLHRLAVAA
jgi:hypothetical protein